MSHLLLRGLLLGCRLDDGWRRSQLIGALAGVSVCASVLPVSAQITISTVPVGNAGNAPDPLTGYGAVEYEYRIGTTEVTIAQYTAFLNAVARSDPGGLYNANMSGSASGITRTGVSPSFTYTVAAGRANNPVNYVTYINAFRFANWLHNGQPIGAQGNATTEDGAYTLTPANINTNTITRNASALWGIPTQNEWYKAAYYQPASQGGDTDDYWLYPTQSNTPTPRTAANYATSNSTRPVGSYAPNFFGAYDMGGNVDEWNMSLSPWSAIIRGGTWVQGVNSLRSDVRQVWGVAPTLATAGQGFRVVQLPTPSGLLLASLAALTASRRRRCVDRGVTVE